MKYLVEVVEEEKEGCGWASGGVISVLIVCVVVSLIGSMCSGDDDKTVSPATKTEVVDHETKSETSSTEYRESIPCKVADNFVSQENVISTNDTRTASVESNYKSGGNNITDKIDDETDMISPTIEKEEIVTLPQKAQTKDTLTKAELRKQRREARRAKREAKRNAKRR